MTTIVEISLENEMDLVLAHKRSMKVADKLGLTVATQTTFATAVSEVARTVIEQTDNGCLLIGLEQYKQRYSLIANVSFKSDVRFTAADDGFYYAQKLLPEFQLTNADDVTCVEMKIGLPRSLALDADKISPLIAYFSSEMPLNPYDEIKQHNRNLNRIAGEQEEELKQSRLIDAKKTEFMSTASHEIKTPITIIKAYTQMASSMKEQCSEQVQGILTKINSQTDKLLSLVQQLLDISRMEHGQLQYNMELVEMAAFINEMCAIIQQVLPYHQIITDSEESLWVHIDKIRMEQVFSNLLVNAAKYSKKGTVIHVRAAHANNLVQVEVADHGIGMSAESMASVFDKFYRDKDVLRTHAGLGMGLYITSKIITDHQGKIWAKSVEGGGSTFYFAIPAQSAATNG